MNAVGFGAIGPLHCMGQEIIRRIFVTVRDRHWREIRPSQWAASPRDGGTEVAISARHTGELVDFEWTGSVSISEDYRHLFFWFNGMALRDMEICRVGLAVLHPVECMVGARVVAIGPRGCQEVIIDASIAPQPLHRGLPGAITDPFSQISIEQPSVGRIDLELSGDLFELEDQRNWGDASFKTYCTPLRQGFPRRIALGTSIYHSVKMTHTPSRSAHSVVRMAGFRRRLRDVAPQIGRLVRGSESMELLRGWSHFRFDLDQGSLAIYSRLVREAPPNTKFEVSIKLSAGKRPAREIVHALLMHPSRLCRILVRDAAQPLPDGRSVALLRQALAGSAVQDLPLYVLPNGYFVEFNRAVPFDLPVDGVAFPLSPTVHSDDPETVMENIGCIEDMASTLRKVAGNRSICISPLALHYPGIGESTPAQVVALPWLSGAIAHASRAGVTAISLGFDLLYPSSNGVQDD